MTKYIVAEETGSWYEDGRPELGSVIAETDDLHEAVIALDAGRRDLGEERGERVSLLYADTRQPVPWEDIQDEDISEEEVYNYLVDRLGWDADEAARAVEG